MLLPGQVPRVSGAIILIFNKSKLILIKIIYINNKKGFIKFKKLIKVLLNLLIYKLVII